MSLSYSHFENLIVVHLSFPQLGNKNDIEGHAPVKELIKCLSVFYVLCFLLLGYSYDVVRQLDKITDRPVSVSFNLFLLFGHFDVLQTQCYSVR